MGDVRRKIVVDGVSLGDALRAKEIAEGGR